MANSDTNHYPAPVLERFWSFVERRGDDECWPWLGPVLRGGRGRFHFLGGSKTAPRFAYEAATGLSLGVANACHSCDNPNCVNPAHLWAGTQKENMDDMVSKGRHHRGRVTECKRGHPLDEKNTFRNSRGWRNCRRCRFAIKRAGRRGMTLAEYLEQGGYI